MHTLLIFFSVESSIKYFSEYRHGTSMSKQSEFHACATFLVKVKRGCTFWQVGNQLCRDTYPRFFLLILASNALHGTQMRLVCVTRVSLVHVTASQLELCWGYISQEMEHKACHEMHPICIILFLCLTIGAFNCMQLVPRYV